MPNCRTCEIVLPADTTDQRFCRRCGWPLALASPRSEPSTNSEIALAGAQATTVRFFFQNLGLGELEVRMSAPPHGVAVQENLHVQQGVDGVFRLTVPPRRGAEERAITLLVNPTEITKETDELQFVFETLDACGEFPADYRPGALETAWKERTFSLRVSRRRIGLLCHKETLLFRGDRELVQYLPIENTGDVPVAVTLTGEGSVLLAPVASGTRRATCTITIPEGHMELFEVGLTPEAEAALMSNGTVTQPSLRITSPALPASGKEIGISLVTPPPPVRPLQRWIIGIDFGTAKTAASLLENLPGVPPKPIAAVWKDTNNTEHLKVPSALVYPEKPDRPRFGFRATNESSAELKLRSMKKHLSGDATVRLPVAYNPNEVPIQKVVTDFLREIISVLRRQPMLQDAERKSGRNPLADALIVMSLPVLTDPDLYELQRRRTEEAARAAGLTQNMIVFYPEPECAAVDYLLRKEEFNLHLKTGENIAVFDCGAGTIDICILEVGTEGGAPSFTRKALAGFPFGGDLIDELLADAAWEHWATVDANLNPQAKTTTTTAKQTKKSSSTQDYTVAGIKAYRGGDRGAVEILRELKENLQYPPSDQDQLDYDAFLNPAYFFPVNWETIRVRFKPYLDMILTQDGGVPAGTEIPDSTQPNGITIITEARKPLKTVLYEANIDPADIKHVLLTGGGSLMPFISDALTDFFSVASVNIVPDEATRERLLADPGAPHTLNVAMGAAARACYRFDRPLPFALSFRLSLAGPSVPEERKIQEQDGLSRDISPPHTAYADFQLPRRCQGMLQVIRPIHDATGQVIATQVLYQMPVENRGEEGALFAMLEYQQSGKIVLGGEYLLGGIRTAISPEPVEVLR